MKAVSVATLVWCVPEKHLTVNRKSAEGHCTLLLYCSMTIICLIPVLLGFILLHCHANLHNEYMIELLPCTYTYALTSGS